MSPIVSIITASYNKVEFISETIDSVMQQTYPNWELLIIDDVSTDGTIDIIKAYAKSDERIRLICNEKNKGANFSRNLGIKSAKGKYIIFLDADDLLTSTCIENRVNIIENSLVDFCVFSMQVFYKQIGDASFIWNPKSHNPLRDFLQHNLPWQTSQPIWKRELLLRCQGFDEDFSRLQDVELHTRILLMPGIKYTLHSQYIDCYYRIDNNRKNFNQYEFLKRWVNSSIMYYNKFRPQLPENQKKYLLGTILRIYFQIILDFKTKKISFPIFQELENLLFSNELRNDIGKKKKYICQLFFFYNYKLPRIPGVNWLFYKLIVL